MVYIKEAHAMDSMMPSSFGGVEDPITDEERHQVCVRCIDDLGIPIPAVVDDMDDSVNRAYGAWPDRLRSAAMSPLGPRSLPRRNQPWERIPVVLGSHRAE